ncbi:hypothetical protein niasHT_024375 [Heterodera trifolii]|uniref:Uncharacterized protein n=1 Tax=Heterodera trifolii TaxID=157864 RepID=A0ABD2JY38_9BILA
MMKLRTKSQNLSLSDEQTPSTSAASAAPFVHAGMRRLSTNSNDQHSSPDSPVIGRIAKSNARILNGLDLNDEKRSGVCVDVFGIFPELKVDELNADKYPNIHKFLSSTSSRKSFDVDNLQSVQHELEELISLNVDCQKTIHGEITYMSTGDYPTIDLSNRPMPKYELHSRHGYGIHREARLCSGEQSSDVGSFTNFLIDLGLLSSPEEEEPPHILDVPSRFWTWAKEYLKPITKATIREFEQKVLERFVGERYTSRIAAAPPKAATTTTTTAHSAGQKSHKRKAAATECQQQQRQNHHALATEHNPAKKLLKLDKSLSAESPLTTPAAKSGGGGIIAKQQPSNGIISAAKNGIILETVVVPLPPATTPPTAAAVEKDEVLAELERKQQQLKTLYEQNRPVVEQLYGRLREEYAVHEVFKRLDSADNSLMQLGSKYKRLALFNSEQRHQAAQALSTHSKVYRTFNGHGHGQQQQKQ